MSDSVFQIIFLGENSSWSKLFQALKEAPTAPLHLRRFDSLAELFQALAADTWHAVVLDVHVGNFQGLHFVEKIRSEYPALPIVALYSPSVPDLDAKAITSGASRCLSLDHFSAYALHHAVASCFSDVKLQSHSKKGSQMPLTLDSSDSYAFASSKNQVIAHALNNLLCVISANADILSDQLEDSAQCCRSLTEIKKAAQSAAALMRHLK
jgi:DNA-binding NarL/FixJ family response regulator